MNVPTPADGISPLAWAASPVVAVVAVVVAVIVVVALCEDEL